MDEKVDQKIAIKESMNPNVPRKSIKMDREARMITGIREYLEEWFDRR